MQCSCQIKLYRSQDGGITTRPSEGWGDRLLTVPGGQCMACRLKLSREWAVRAMHESSQYENNIFATITYHDDHLPYGNSLDRDEIKHFHMRLSKRYPKHRKLYCGEYGDETNRPHYHGLYFNLDLPDKELLSTRNGKSVYRSPKLDLIWGRGHINFFNEITPQSAAYVAGYTKKKSGKLKKEAYEWMDPETGQIFDRLPEFKGQSLKPGIGYQWITRFLSDVYEKDQIIHDGKAMPPPRYYDKICEKENPALWRKVKLARLEIQRKKQKESDLIANKDKSKIPYQGSERHGRNSEFILNKNKLARKET